MPYEAGIMNLKTKYKLMLWKSYVDRGRGITSYFNELFLLFGFWSITAKKSVAYLTGIFLAYFFLCLIVGWLWFFFKWEITEREVGNKYNFFQKEIRRKMRIKEKI